VPLSVVIPCYRSAATLPTLVARLTHVLNRATPTYEILLVVDGDAATWATARELVSTHPAVRAIRLARNYGQQAALVAGVRAARYDITVTMDDDLQHPPEEIPNLLAALREDVDLVYGVPEREQHGQLRNASSYLAKAAIAGTLGVSHAKDLSAFRVFRTYLRQAFDLITGPHVSVDVALGWGTTAVASVEVRTVRRPYGRSGYTARALLRHAMNLFLGYSTALLRLSTYLGFALGLTGLILVLRLVWLYYHGQTAVAGFTTIASLVAIFSAAQLMAIGVLGEYVGRIHAGGMGRPTYVIRERAEPAETDSLSSLRDSERQIATSTNA
jgi:undecaprenyl-phosphate 4-deoxy-4-formamido-L-arabinose transferase